MLNRLEKKGQFPQHLITQALNIQGEKKNIYLKLQGKKQVMYKGRPITITPDLVETLKARRARTCVL